MTTTEGATPKKMYMEQPQCMESLEEVLLWAGYFLQEGAARIKASKKAWEQETGEEFDNISAVLTKKEIGACEDLMGEASKFNEEWEGYPLRVGW